jgi:hypothetical protein
MIISEQAIKVFEIIKSLLENSFGRLGYNIEFNTKLTTKGLQLSPYALCELKEALEDLCFVPLSAETFNRCDTIGDVIELIIVSLKESYYK